MKISCRFCDKDMKVDEFDFARYWGGEIIFCEECYEEYKENINRVRKV